MSRSDFPRKKRAVALHYGADDTAPVVVASGMGYLAEKMVDVAQANGVPVYEDDSLATVLTQLQLGQEIEARVIKIDKDVRRIGLSIKALEEGFNEEDLKAAGEEVSAALRPGEALGSVGTLIGNSLDGLDVLKDSKEDAE